MLSSLLVLALAQADEPETPPCDRKAWLARLTDEASRRAAVAPAEKRGPWTQTHPHPCGAVSTSDDGKLRLWVPAFEKVDPEEEELQSGEAYLQWLDDKGGMHAKQLDPSMHLDNVVDRIVTLEKGRYLILGLRSCFTIYAGGCPRRYARVVQLDATDNVTSISLFLFGGPNPETDKFRHHLLASNWLAWRDGKVWVEPFPGYSFGTKLKPTAVLEARKASLRRVGTPPGELRIVRDW